MTKVFVDGDYQSVAEKTHPQRVPGGEVWTSLRWVDEAGKSQRALMVKRAGRQDVDYAVRVDAQAAVNLVWTRVQRYPVDPADNGTHWQGPFRTTPGKPLHLTGHALDNQAGKVGRGYGVDVKLADPARVSTFIAKLDPR